MRTSLPEIGRAAAKGGPDATKSAAQNPSRACKAAQAAISAQPNALIRRFPRTLVMTERRPGGRSLEMYAAIRVLLDGLIDRVTRHLGARRREICDKIGRAALGPLPTEPYVFFLNGSDALWASPPSIEDGHVEVGKHYYSAPYCWLAREGLGPAYRKVGRDIPPRATRSRPCQKLWQSPAHDDPGSHAGQSPASFRMVRLGESKPDARYEGLAQISPAPVRQITAQSCGMEQLRSSHGVPESCKRIT